jgi:hypothetical protein
MLLIFAAALTCQFRFVSTVTILQQNYSPIFVRRRTPWASAENSRTTKAKGITGSSPAEELGKRWRFFPTYAGV